jgi:hypothetical protein
LEVGLVFEIKVFNRKIKLNLILKPEQNLRDVVKDAGIKP